MDLYDPTTDCERRSQTTAAAKRLESLFRRELNAVIVNYLPGNRLEKMLVKVLSPEIGLILGLPRREDDADFAIRATTGEDQEMTDDSGGGVVLVDRAGVKRWSSAPGRKTSPPKGPRLDEDSRRIRAARRKVIRIFRALENVGLGGDRSQRVFAELMNDAMTTYVTETFSDQWRAPSTVPTSLRAWVEDGFARLAVEVLHCVLAAQPEAKSAPDRAVELVSLEDVEKWREMSIGRLGRLRISQLFDIVVEWDTSEGAVHDLKASLSLSAACVVLSAETGRRHMS